MGEDGCDAALNQRPRARHAASQFLEVGLVNDILFVIAVVKAMVIKGERRRTVFGTEGRLGARLFLCRYIVDGKWIFIIKSSEIMSKGNI